MAGVDRLSWNGIHPAGDFGARVGFPIIISRFGLGREEAREGGELFGESVDVESRFGERRGECHGSSLRFQGCEPDPYGYSVVTYE